LTTPEKWDSVTRRWKDNIFLLGSIKSVLIDEVHLLGDKERGACLESVICRMKTLKKDHGEARERSIASKKGGTSSSSLPSPPQMRFVAVSATLPNIKDIGEFLEVPTPLIFSFDETFRPVPLNIVVRGCGVNTNEYIFEKSLSKHVAGTINEFCDGKPTIVFCHSKKDCETLALEFEKDNVARGKLSNAARSALRDASSRSSTQPLSRCLLGGGVACHPAGLDPDDRQLVEQVFTSLNNCFLFATSTLAMGVNLPARLVVMKGTRAWMGNIQGHQDVDSGTLLQMMGSGTTRL
jgi:ATP-dependent DNA helicase HFM1/MER3